MNKTFPTKVFFFCLIVPSVIASFLLCAGCQSQLPVIELEPLTESVLSRHTQPRYYLAGDFTAVPAEYGGLAVYLRNYLDKALSERISQTQHSAVDSAPDVEVVWLINGGLKVLNRADPLDSNRLSFKVETKFDLTEKDTGRVFQSITLSEFAPQYSREGIRTALRSEVNTFLGDYFPDRSAILSRMARGWTEVGRRGRKSAGRGEYSKAFSCFRRAVDERPDDHAALYNAGLMCETLCDYPRAQRYYRRAMRLADKKVYKDAHERIQQRIRK